jgi:hypothetical protein
MPKNSSNRIWVSEGTCTNTAGAVYQIPIKNPVVHSTIFGMSMLLNFGVVPRTKESWWDQSTSCRI